MADDWEPSGPSGKPLHILRTGKSPFFNGLNQLCMVMFLIVMLGVFFHGFFINYLGRSNHGARCHSKQGIWGSGCENPVEPKTPWHHGSFCRWYLSWVPSAPKNSDNPTSLLALINYWNPILNIPTYHIPRRTIVVEILPWHKNVLRSWSVVGNLPYRYGGFLSHRATPSHHPFSWICPYYKHICIINHLFFNIPPYFFPPRFFS